MCFEQIFGIESVWHATHTTFPKLHKKNWPIFKLITVRGTAPCFDFSPLSVFASVTCAARGFISDTIDASANWWLSRIKDKEEREREGREEALARFGR